VPDGRDDIPESFEEIQYRVARYSASNFNESPRLKCGEIVP